MVQLYLVSVDDPPEPVMQKDVTSIALVGEGDSAKLFNFTTSNEPEEQ